MPEAEEGQRPEFITLLLGRVREGDREALEQLLPLVSGELHRLPDRRCGGIAGCTRCSRPPC